MVGQLLALLYVSFLGSGWVRIMSTYNPDNWVIVKIGDDYKVLAGWSGSYLYGDSWRLSSGIVRIEDHSDVFRIYNHSGSCYVCRKSGYKLRRNNSYVWREIQKTFGDDCSILDEHTDWGNLV